MARQLVSKAFTIALLALPLSVAQGAAPDLAAELQGAEADYAKARAQGFAWRANRQALDAARGALERGAEVEARDLIAEANRLAQLSLEQATREAQAWRNRPPFAP